MKFKLGEIFTLSNMFSMLRLLMAIPIYFMLDNLGDSYNYRLFFIAVLLVTGATDAFDGYFARKWNQITEFGKIIDPLADKVVVTVVVLKMFLIGELPGYYFWPVVLRDILIFIGGIFVTSKIGRVLPSNMLGKITVVFISLFIFAVILLADEYAPAVYYLLEYLSLALVIASFIGYVIRAKEALVKS